MSRRLLPLLFALAWPAAAHVLSMSSGELTLDGAHAHYELRMPLYEIPHVSHPDRVLLDHVQFAGARLTARECHAAPENDAYLCAADYVFPAPVDQVDVECTLASVTVPGHVHLLHASMGAKHDQAVFDINFTRAKIRFHPPGPAEIAATESGSGFLRALGGPVQILFLGALVLAARSRRELVLLAAMFLAGQCAAAVLVPLTHWQPAARFVEAAAALTIAYLAVEILLLPQAGARWLVAAVLGAFHGLYLLLFVQNTGYHAPLVLAGAAIGQSITILLLGWLVSRIAPLVGRWRPVQACASALLIFGVTWFVLRLRG